MKRWYLPLGALVILLVISFAASLYPGGVEMVDPSIGLEIQRTWKTTEGPEGQMPIDGRTWQYVDVDMRNLNDEASIDISTPHFFARASDGSEVWVHNSEDFSYPELGPGENATVHLVFMPRVGSVLEELEYSQRASGPIRCDIPLL